MILRDVAAKDRESRRRFLRTSLGLGCALAGVGCAPAVVPSSPTPARPAIATPTIVPTFQFTSWGWPLPYEPVSARSIDWLQQRTWWPLGIGYQHLASGQNAVFAMLTTYRLMDQRRLQAFFTTHISGAELEQVFVAGRVQVAVIGGLPLDLMIERGVPVVSVAIVTPNLKIGTVVPSSSTLQRLSQLKGSMRAIGVELNSVALAYLAIAASMNGLTLNQDVFTQGMSVDEQATLPPTVAAVVPWEPTVSLVVDQRRTGRTIDVAFPYQFTNEHVVVRQELVDNVPDVVQALVDCYQEAVLLTRLRPQQATGILATDPRLTKYSVPLLMDQTFAYNNLYRPTFTYPFAEFWATENASVTNLLALSGHLTQPIDASTWQKFVTSRFMDQTFARLGWRVPSRPTWIPNNWTGTVGQPPYPPYDTVDSLHTPQPWPTPADLVRPWQFARTTYYP
ncbi:MAG TPA: ABC transporter substrate-binding protein [Chloroflexota bacterium]|nr:ABC transporter substrate-binding protein [Chloroflexota bacterium]